MGRYPGGVPAVRPTLGMFSKAWDRNIGGPAGDDAFDQSGLTGGGIKLDVAAGRLKVFGIAAEGMAVVGAGISAPSQSFSADRGASAEERVSLDAEYRFTAAWHAFAGLGITHHEYTGSKPNGLGLYEPLSATFQINSLGRIAYGF